jgi:regulator of sigma E protease
MTYLLCIFESLLAVSLLVVVHEFGHMIAGKAFGVPSHRFCIGLGPRLFGFRFRGTEYCFAPVPLGGYVQLDSVHRHGEGQTCMSCLPPWKKVLVYFAGPAANLIFVLFLFWTVFFVMGYRDHVPVIGKVDPGSPAFHAGFRAGDRILSINGKKIISWTQAAVEFDRSQARSRKAALGSPGSEREAGILLEGDSGGARTLDATWDDLAGAFQAEETVRLRLGPVHAAKKSVEKFTQLSKLLFQSLTGLMTARVSPSELVGPLYLFHVSAQAAVESQGSLVYLLAVISACLFFFNLLPLPVLDGGQIALAMLEKVLKRPLAPQSMRLLIHASVGWLILLMTSATLNDIVRLLGS